MPGVAFNAPPNNLMASVQRQIDTLAAQLSPDVKGAVIAVATDTGWNAAIVHRAGNHFQVVSWVGKSWGSQLAGGGAVKVTW
jgi:hypothetical protein